MQQSRVKIKFHFIMVKASHNNTYANIKSVKSYSNRYLVGLQTFTMGGGMHGLFKSICRFGANPEKVFRIH